MSPPTVNAAIQPVYGFQGTFDGTVLKAPMAGTVTALNGTVGDPCAFNCTCASGLPPPC